MLKAVEHINTEISESILGLDATNKRSADRTLVELNSANESRLGANAMLAVSMAVARAAAEEAGLPLYHYFGGSAGMQMPVPMMNVVTVVHVPITTWICRSNDHPRGCAFIP